MPYIDNLQEFIANVMIPFAAIAGGALLGSLLIVTMIATMVNALMDR
jgi:hypothetical protein